jgi:ketosteroid isomerase-like protein
VASALPDIKMMRHMSVYGILLLLAGMMVLSRWHHPVPSSAAVEMGLGVVAEADQAVGKEVAAAFDRAEAAVQHGDLDALMLFYENGYNYHGLKRSDVQRVWTEVFSHYREINSSHRFTELKVVRAGSVMKAFVTCTGGLYGTDKASGKPVTIDSWVGEVHHLVKEGSTWKFLGNVGGVPEVPVTSAPHHPLF